MKHNQTVTPERKRLTPLLSRLTLGLLTITTVGFAAYAILFAIMLTV